MEEFTQRVSADIKHYGTKTQEANNQGINFKAISHAIRTLYQLEELLKTGRITFPLRECHELRDIKNGKRSWPKLKSYILNKVAELKQIPTLRPNKTQQAKDFAKRCILNCYGLTNT